MANFSFRRPFSDPSGKSMWLFDPLIAPLRSRYQFNVRIDYHVKNKIVGSYGFTSIDPNPLQIPLAPGDSAEVEVEYVDNVQRLVSEKMAVANISARDTKSNMPHVIIKGDRIGSVVVFKRNERGKQNARVVFADPKSGDVSLVIARKDLCPVQLVQ